MLAEFERVIPSYAEHGPISVRKGTSNGHFQTDDVIAVSSDPNVHSSTVGKPLPVPVVGGEVRDFLHAVVVDILKFPIANGIAVAGYCHAATTRSAHVAGEMGVG